MTRLEYLQCWMLAGDSRCAAPDDAICFYRRAGWGGQALTLRRFLPTAISLPDIYRRIQEGETLRIGGHGWEIVVGAGHAPEHAYRHDAGRKLLISGDQVLPRIFSNVSVHPSEPDADPLDDWLFSLRSYVGVYPTMCWFCPRTTSHSAGCMRDSTSWRPKHSVRWITLNRDCENHSLRSMSPRCCSSPPPRVNDPTQPILATGEVVAHLNYPLIGNEISVNTDERGAAWFQWIVRPAP